MASDRSVVYKGEVFSVLNTGRYYCSGRHGGKYAGDERLLHRRIWVEHNGAIPADHHIHHINEDWRDNRIENLECIPAFEHQRMHMLDRFESDEYREQNKADLDAARLKASEWHGSPEGLAWHSAHAKEQAAKREYKMYNCTECGDVFFSRDTKTPLTCSLKCCDARNRKLQRTKHTSTCRACGKEFSHPKLRDTETHRGCSRRCTLKIRKSNEAAHQTP